MKSKKLIFASDFAPIRRFAPLMKEQPQAVYGDLLPRLQAADYAIVNLESPLHNDGSFIAKSGAAFSGEKAHIHSLCAGNFRAVILANNHTFDSGISGFEATCQLLDEYHIAYAGAGKNIQEARRELAFNTGDVRIAVFTVSEGEDMLGATVDTPGVRPWEVKQLADDIRAARKKYDIILVSAHCGLEYQPFPSFYVYEAFEKWAAAGADMIIGHHPHVPQGMTFFGRTPAYFSLGNFVFYQPVDLLYRKTGYFLELEVDKSGIISSKAVPYRIGDNGLKLLTGDDEKWFEKLFSRISEPLRTRQGALQAWHAVLAYNGPAGFQEELSRISRTLQDDPVKGAAMLRNRLTCIQHSSQWLDGMTRIIDGTISDSPAELIAEVKTFMTEKTAE
ncbi:MAG: CapA family protein [Lentisphaeria bacterium]|nr:CapA family protein [Lentisphaeria bacterium]